MDRAIEDSIDQSGGLNLVNIYLLRFAIKTTVLMNCKEITDNSNNLSENLNLQNEIDDVYKDYRIIKSLGIDSTKKKSFDQYIKLLEIVTGIPNEEDFESL